MSRLPQPGRFPYSAIVDRPRFAWPGGAGLACYLAINLEHFAEMLEQSRRAPLVFAVALHPYLFGQPHRLRVLRDTLAALAHRPGTWWTTPGAIADAYAAIVPAAEAGYDDATRL